MRVFNCDNCGQLVFFDNSRCLRCNSPLGYVHQRRDVVALTEVAPDRLVDLASPVRTWQRCATESVTGCNWLVPAGTGALCESCVLTRTRPSDGDRDGMVELVQGEMAKRRLVFQLAELGLPIAPRDEQAGRGLAFDLLSSTETKVITGHDNGVITLDLAEADGEHRERLRLQLNEPYRTLLGHFRHEIGHYYWPILVDRPEVLEACRTIFGDDREPYAAAVQRHYDAPPDEERSWSGRYISSYATMHPYEDWAETFAHYLHILDTLQTADSFGLGVNAASGAQRLAQRIGAHPTRPDGSATFGDVVDHWLELSYALNQINRSMGRDDLYPFVLAPTVIRKLAFVDHIVHRD
ncbi:MAG: putative zinc-binding metallopeptidase [Acidimicrobiales bacterium]|jgi:hypothetical protein